MTQQQMKQGIKDGVKAGVKKVKENELVTRALAPKNSFWKKTRNIALIVAGASEIVSLIPIHPIVNGIAAVLSKVAWAIAGTAQLTKK